MRSRTLASLFAFCLLTSGAAALQDAPTFTVEYPLSHYRLTTDSSDEAGRARAVQALSHRLSSSLSAQLVDSRDRMGRTSVVTGLPLARSIRPIRLLWNDPLYLFRPPVTVEWLELVDERGFITRVWVTASNQSPESDKRIIGWCISDAIFRPIDAEGRSSMVLRNAGITLVGSPWHYTYWLQRLRTRAGGAVAIVFAGILFWLVRRVVVFRRDRRLRHEQMMARLHRGSPYRPPSIDDET